MATINLGERKKRDVTFNKKAFQRWYNTTRWIKLRAAKFRNDPLCELCLLKDPPVIRQADEVHHKIPIDIRHPDEELIYDYDNLMSLCIECHSKVHKTRGMNPVEALIEMKREVR